MTSLRRRLSWSAMAALCATLAWTSPLGAAPAPVATPSAAPPHATAAPSAVPSTKASLPWENQAPAQKPIQPGDTVLLGQDGMLDMVELLDYARATHPKLRIYQAQYAQAIGQLHLSESLYVPTGQIAITRSHTYTQNGGIGTPTPLTPALPSTIILLNPAASLSYLLSDGGKRVNSVARDRANLLTSVYSWRNQWRTLAQTIESDYLSVALNRTLLEVQEEGVRMADETLKQAEGLFRGGKKTRLDVLQSQADLEGARALYVAQKGQLTKAWARLGADVGAPLNEFAKLDPVLTSPLPLPPTANLLDTALAQRSDLLTFANQIAYQRWQVRVNKTQLNPTLNTLLSYGYTGADFPALTTWQFGLTLTVPLTQGPSVRAQNELAEGLIVELLAHIYDLRLTIINDLSQSWIGLQAAQRKVTIDEAQIREADQAYRLAAKRYMGGISQYIEVTNARQVLNNARV
ncbi:MAG: TolC family protein, partial [Proteobacteria bacterium]|nr:TolC family protein [Pseudomonadota bacterium]